MRHPKSLLKFLIFIYLFIFWREYRRQILASTPIIDCSNPLSWAHSLDYSKKIMMYSGKEASDKKRCKWRQNKLGARTPFRHENFKKFFWRIGLWIIDNGILFAHLFQDNGILRTGVVLSTSNLFKDGTSYFCCAPEKARKKARCHMTIQFWDGFFRGTLTNGGVFPAFVDL